MGDDFPLKPEISDWSARIVKVEKIENDESSILYDYEKKGGNLNEWPQITIFMHGHGLFFFLIAAPTLIILFLYLLTKAKIVDIRLSKPFVSSHKIKGLEEKIMLNQSVHTTPAIALR
ncbi:hypothetical protein [Desulfotignum balticum]|jgi:hypothetical protein|uniref:hypothetical protein n=1 Tax=Desulfotignum balticum TaxID=115781 RepID=UPI0004625B3A|nr:hypothetical protein [Desulfotignum balticum]